MPEGKRTRMLLLEGALSSKDGEGLGEGRYFQH
jgi:hypothetical protein